MCALECQKVSRPSSLLNVNNLSPQSPSSALDMSHKTPFTWEINALEAKPFDISLAISKGVVSHFFPSFTVPSGKVILRHKNIKNQPTIPKKKKRNIYIYYRNRERNYFMGSPEMDRRWEICWDLMDSKRAMRLGMTQLRYSSSFGWEWQGFDFASGTSPMGSPAVVEE